MSCEFVQLLISQNNIFTSVWYNITSAHLNIDNKIITVLSIYCAPCVVNIADH